MTLFCSSIRYSQNRMRLFLSFVNIWLFAIILKLSNQSWKLFSRLQLIRTKISLQLPALSGLLFPGKEEAAFSNFRLWESTGSVITYVYSPYLCTQTKLYCLIAILCLGMIGYGIIEWTGKADKSVPESKPDFELVTNGELNDTTKLWVDKNKINESFQLEIWSLVRRCSVWTSVLLVGLKQ